MLTPKYEFRNNNRLESRIKLNYLIIVLEIINQFFFKMTLLDIFRIWRWVI